MDSAGVPLLYPLDSNSSPWGIRCGGAYLLPRVYTNLGFRFPVQTVCPHFDVVFECFVFGLKSFAFQ